MGKQVLSTKSSGASVGFGSGKRLADHGSDVPGPGACVGGGQRSTGAGQAEGWQRTRLCWSAG